MQLRKARLATARPERRKMVRRGIPRIQVRFASSAGSGSGQLRNIAQHGIFVASPLLPPAGTLIELAFQVAGAAHVQVRGVVRWHTSQLPEAEREGRKLCSGFGVQIPEPSQSFVAFYRAVLLGKAP